MKESRFIELLNLYIDQEISPEEAALLEQEILRNSQRRKIYVQYCRMHRGSALLFDRYRAGGVPSGDKLAQAARDVDEKVVLFPQTVPTRTMRRWGVAAGLAAAAACVALVLVRFESSRERPAAGMDMAAMVSTPTAAQAVSAPRSPAVIPATGSNRMGAVAANVAASAPRDYQPAFVVRPLNQAPVALTEQENQAANRLAWEWMQRVNLSPMRIVPADDLLFESRPALQQDPRTFRGLKPVQANVEMTAFQFQK